MRLDGKPVQIPSRPAQSLFVYLILNAKTTHRREKLAGLLWPDSPEDSARGNLRHALWRLHKALDSSASFRFLRADDLTISLSALSDYWLDTAELEKLSDNASADDLMAVLSEYRGELLPGFYDDWIMLEREHLYSIFEHNMARLLSLLQDENRWLDTLDWSERWIRLGQSPEPAYRGLMSAHAAKGDMSKVAATYERCVRSLREFGLTPSEQTKELYEKLKSGEKNLSTKPSVSVPAREESPPGTNLPAPITSFIGREKEVREVVGLVGTNRLVTLTGSGGVGKTRLAVQSSTELLSKFRDGVCWVDLALLVDGALVPQAVAQALGVRESLGEPLTEALRRFLRQKQLLLVLDNCEHLVMSCAQLADDLLTHSGTLRILATSREPLGITGESVYQVPTLSLPGPGHLALTDTLLQFEGIRLFVERSASVKPDFALTERNAPAVLQICRQLDGIPLALELAAARTRLLSAEHIAEHLKDRFDLLTQGSRTALPRQQTLRATIDWSYDLLPEQERILFQRLSVFAGGFTLQAAEAICSGGPPAPHALLDSLSRLVDRSLLRVERQSDDVRYQEMETLREYARQKLVETGETERLRQRHASFFIALAEQAEPDLKGPGQFEWLDRLEAEHDNLRVAWDSALDRDAGLAGRLASALLDFWSMRGDPGEGRQWLAQLLPRTNRWGQSAKRAHLLSVAGRLAYLQRDFAAARQLLEEGLAIARMANHQNEIAFALLWLGWNLHRQHQDVAAEAYLEECLAICRGLQDEWTVAMIIYQLAALAGAQGRHAEAEQRYMESLAIFQQLGDSFRAGYVLNGLGELARLLGNYERAGQYYEQHMEVLRARRGYAALATSLVNLGWVYLRAGDYVRAKATFEESSKLAQGYGNKNGMALSLAGLGGVLGMIGKPNQAAKLFGAAQLLLESIGMAGRMDAADQQEFDYYVGVVQAKLDSAAFAQAWNGGRAMSPEQALDLALGESGY